MYIFYCYNTEKTKYLLAVKQLLQSQSTKLLIMMFYGRTFLHYNFKSQLLSFTMVNELAYKRTS